MKTINLRMFFLFLLSLTVFSCVEDNDIERNCEINKEVIGDKTPSKLDEYLDREFLKPYNIKFQYRLDDIQADMDFNVVPASEEKAIKIARLIKYLCLEPYEMHTDKNFLQKYFPKTIMLVGSGAFKKDGSFILGTAAGGVKIVLYRINDVDTSNAQLLLEWYFNTIFHEFSHILHQKKMFSPDFEKISKTDYVADSWNTHWDTWRVFKPNDKPSKLTAKYLYLPPWAKTMNDAFTAPPSKMSFQKGFISDYSSNKVEDDFVEVIAHYITLTDEQFENKINPEHWTNVGDDPTTPEIEYLWKKTREGNQEGVDRMNQKLEIIKAYLQDSWNINLDELRAEVQKRLKNVKNFDATNIE